MPQLSDIDFLFLSALNLALDLPHADLPLDQIKAVLNAEPFNSVRLYELIQTCPSLHQQFRVLQTPDPNKGSQFPPAAIDDTPATNTELGNKFPVNDQESLLAAVLKKLENLENQIKP